MAKGKHAAALFEVIHSDRRFGKKTPPSRALATPKWWFKGRAKPDGDVAPAAAAPAPVAAPEPIEFMPSVPGTVARPVDVKVNSDRQEISFRLTYNGAVVGGFALIVVLGLAFIIGRRLSGGPASATAAPVVSSEQIRKGKPQPGVLDLQTAARGATNSTPTEDESAHVLEPTPQVTPAKPGTGVTIIAQPQRTVVIDDNPNRSNGLNYVVIQSFRYEQKNLAEEAVKFLREGGVVATVEKDVPGWVGWVSVVGTKGFDSTKSPQYDAYIEQILAISPKFAGKSKWKQFAPTPKKWAGNS